MNAVMFLQKIIQNKYVNNKYINIYRIITGIGFIAAAALVLTSPLKLLDPDDWVNYLATQYFSNGNFTIDYDTISRDAIDITTYQGGIILQYMPLENGRWALEKAPGYIFYLVPFFKLGIPRCGNILLALGMTIVTYLLLKRMRDEKASMIGSLLMLYTPISPVMLNRTYMDTFASLAFLVIGSGLYLYHYMENDKISVRKSIILLFLAFLFISWSVVVRYSNLLMAATLAVHYAVVRFMALRRGKFAWLKKELVPVILGIGIPLAVLLIYNHCVFGSPLSYGYRLSPFPIKFAFQYIGQVDVFGKSIPVQILQYNTEAFIRNIFIGFPVLVIGIPAFIFVIYQKIAGCFQRGAATGTWSGIRGEMPWDFLIVLICWFIFVFGLYWCYEFSAAAKYGGGAAVFCRLLLPGLFPIVIISALVLARLPWWIYAPVTAVLTAGGIAFYIQWVYKLYILPAWVTERYKERWKDCWLPWCKTFDELAPKYYPWYIDLFKLKY